MGPVRIMIAGEGHIFGWENVLKERNHCTSLRCISEYGKIIKIPGMNFKEEVNQDEMSI